MVRKAIMVIFVGLFLICTSSFVLAGEGLGKKGDLGSQYSPFNLFNVIQQMELSNGTPVISPGVEPELGAFTDYEEDWDEEDEENSCDCDYCRNDDNIIKPDVEINSLGDFLDFIIELMKDEFDPGDEDLNELIEMLEDADID